jgi:hypothetical protein
MVSQPARRLQENTTLATGLAYDAAANQLMVVAGGIDPDVISFAGPVALSGPTPTTWQVSGAAAGLQSGVRAAVDPADGELFAVVVFALGASGDPSPLCVLSGPATQLAHPVDIAVDATNGIIAASNDNNTIVLFPCTASGDTPPLANIGGGGTGLIGISGVALEPVARELYVASQGTGNVTVYPETANGAAAPSRTLTVTDPAAAPLFGLSLDTAAGRIITFGGGFIRADPLTAQGAPAPAWTAQVGGYPVRCGPRICLQVFVQTLLGAVVPCGPPR